MFIKLIRAVQSFLKPFKKILVLLFEIECKISKYWVASAHKRLHLAEWYIPPVPEFFDHHIDLFYQWLHSRSAFWIERGIFNALALKRGGNVLELCCGDGFYTRNVYSKLVRNIIAVDYNKDAINKAKTKNSADNIIYKLADIRSDMPDGKYDNIIWDAAMEHFNEQEIHKILQDIKNRLTDGGILSGYTIKEREDHKKSLEHHEREFKSKKDLLSFFKPYFKNIIVFETIYPERHNFYFWCSDGVIPFIDGWDLMEKIEQKH